MANALVIVGVSVLSVAGWLVHPAAGLAVAGLSAVAIGIGLVRMNGR